MDFIRSVFNYSYCRHVRPPILLIQHCSRLSRCYSADNTRHPAVTAWDREQNLVARVQLPNTPAHLSAHGSRVGIITSKQEVLIWHVGNSLVLLDTSAACQRFGQISGHHIAHVLFSPVSQINPEAVTVI